VVESIKGIRPFPEVVGVRKIEVLTGEGGGGGRMPPLVVSLTGVWGLLDEATKFTSIFACRTNWRSKDVTSGGRI
jgi:hypothetical protein